MIDGLFTEDGDEDFCVLSADQAKTDSLAGEMQKPPSPRNQCNFVGLLNQGATCYLNSLFQALFMAPELRSAIFSMKLYEESISQPSGWLPEGQKRDILSALQELFVKLAFIDEQAISTQNLTKSFGWTGEEVIVQHDVQELSRVFFDCLERALQGTEYSELISNYIKGKFVNITTCSQCGRESAREELFADIGLRVKGCKGLEESIQALLKEEILDGQNQYFCEHCQTKVNATRATRISKLPQLLSFSLNRFEYDMKSYERVKIHSNFEFGLEIDMGPYCEGGSKYELFAVIIHAGGAHGGHYHAYIRDLLNEGVWEPSLVPAAKKPVADKSKPVDKRQGKKKKKKNRNKRSQKHKKEEKEEPNFDNEDFFTESSDSRLQVNWYDFNDSTVTPIRSGKLKKQFGGTSETAYILIYRLQSIENVSVPEIPSYWATAISSLNEDYKKHRVLYEEQKNLIEIQIQPFELFQVSDDALVYVDQETNTLAQGITVQMEKTDKIEDLKNQITIAVIDELPDVFVTHQIFIGQPLSNKCVHVLRSLDSLENEVSIKEAGIVHKSCFLVLPRENEELDRILEFVGTECEPLSVSCNYQGEKFSVICNKAWPFVRLKEKAQKIINVPLEKLEFKYRKSEGGEKKLSARDDDTLLSDLKFYHTITLTISQKDSEIPMVELKKTEQGDELISVLLTDELTPDKPVQHLIIKDWRVKDLIQESKILFNIQENCRLRKLIDKKIICKEDLDSFLKNIPEFLDGGYRFQVERGEPPAYGLIVLKVAFDCNDPGKEIFVKETEKIADVKIKAAEVLGFQAELFKLYRTDWLKEPICALKQEQQTLFKAAIKDSDFLLVKSADTVVDSETIRVKLYVPGSSYPGDNRLVTELTVAEDTLLKNFKEMLKENPELNKDQKEHIRIRELTKTLWPGKVYKEENKSLKRLAISFEAHLLVESLDEPDSTAFTGVQIYIGERDWVEKCNKNIKGTFFDVGASPSIDHLYKHAIEVLGKDWSVAEITIARFKANSFEWEVLKDERSAEERGKLLGVKASGTAQGIFNLKKKPYFIKDGDLFSVRRDLDDNREDDFGCKGDLERRNEYLKSRQSLAKGKRVAKPEKAIRIGDF